jgi:hypothetical protein
MEQDMPFTHEQWWKLKLATRERWWKETDYSKRPQDASEELLAAIKAELVTLQ